MNSIEEKILKAYKTWKGRDDILSITLLPVSGSSRKYFRLANKYETIIGAYNNNKPENDAFTGFTSHFIKKGLPVPTVYKYFPAEYIYFLQDLGSLTFFDYIEKMRNRDDINSLLAHSYREIVDFLMVFQIEGDKGLNYRLCYPRRAFDKQSVLWDLNYFKYYFLKLANFQFNEQAIEKDFKLFASYLLNTGRDYFLYRDFQSRNIMLHDGGFYFIDYQGGRKGALQYDLASLLYDAKADIPESMREDLLHYYLDKIYARKKISKDEFIKYYYPYVLIRIMQAMGSYGYRGYFERKQHFLASIPFAVRNMKYILENKFQGKQFPELVHILKTVCESESINSINYKSSGKLKIRIYSFAYKNGIPVDNYGHGGGFVFDCRFLPNPGREEKYRALTGFDNEVIEYLESSEEVRDFFDNVCNIITEATANYLKRKFSNLMISFGCTGGQHRSVYFANKIASHIRQKFNIETEVIHRELNNT